MGAANKYTFRIAERVAIWRSWDKRCAYTGEPIPFRDLEIDHVVPEELTSRPNDLDALRTRLNLPNDFEINSFLNWVPTLQHANRQKSSRQFTDSTLLYYLELARAKHPQIIRQYERLQKEVRSERHLAAVARLVDDGTLTIDEVLDFVHSNIRPGKREAEGPLVITLGLRAEILDGAMFYVPTCDDHEEQLMGGLRARLAGFVEQTEPSERNGESLSVRFAVWQASLDAVLACVDPKWELLEVAKFSEIYPDSDPRDAYANAVAAKHKRNTADPNDPIFGLGRCLQCGGAHLNRSSGTDVERDEKYFTIKCNDCGWGDYTQ